MIYLFLKLSHIIKLRADVLQFTWLKRPLLNKTILIVKTILCDLVIIRNCQILKSTYSYI